MKLIVASGHRDHKKLVRIVRVCLFMGHTIWHLHIHIICTYSIPYMAAAALHLTANSGQFFNYTANCEATCQRAVKKKEKKKEKKKNQIVQTV